MRILASGSLILSLVLHSVARGEYAPRGDELLKEKTAQLERLQAEVDALRHETGDSRQILIQVQVVELSLTKLAKLGIALPRLNRNLTGLTLSSKDKEGAQPVGSQKAVVDLLQALRQDKVAKILAEPSFVVLEGVPASLECGTGVPVPTILSDGSKKIEHQQFGTRVDVVAARLGDQKVRLQIRASVREADRTLSITIDGDTVPGSRNRDMDNTIEVQLGHTAVFGAIVQERLRNTADSVTKQEPEAG
jgi:pilus assembly protein CpaC